MTVADIQAQSENWNLRVIGHHDLNGHGDGMQLLKQGRYVYLAHLGTSPMALSRALRVLRNLVLYSAVPRMRSRLNLIPRPISLSRRKKPMYGALRRSWARAGAIHSWDLHSIGIFFPRQ